MKRKITAIISSAVITAMSAAAFAMNAFAEGEAAGNAQQPGSSNFIITFVVPLAIMFLLLYFMAIKPQKKREQEAKTMQESLKVGDEVVTNGGIIGMIFRIGDDNVVIETGGERTKIRIKKWAIAENISAAERMKEAQAKKKSPVQSAGVSEGSEEKKSKKSKKSEDGENE